MHNQPILVTGGTGTLGKHVVRRLVEAGRPVRVPSRHGGPPRVGVEHVVADLSTGTGVAEALDGVEVVLHLAGSAKGDGAKTRTLVSHARRAGVRHIVYISVVGADRVPMRSAMDRMAFGYYGEKRAAELAIEGSGIPWTILRATQFHELLLATVASLTKLPVAIAFDGVRFQPIAADEVAARLVELTLAAPAGRVPDMGGPEALLMTDAVRRYLDATGTRRPVLRMPVGGAAGRAMRAGANLAPERSVGVKTWAQVLPVGAGRK